MIRGVHLFRNFPLRNINQPVKSHLHSVEANRNKLLGADFQIEKWNNLRIWSEKQTHFKINYAALLHFVSYYNSFYILPYNHFEKFYRLTPQLGELFN